MPDQPNLGAPIVTPRLELVPLTLAFLDASLGGDRAAAATLLGAGIPSDWFDDRSIMGIRREDLRADPGLLPWLMRAIVRRDDRTMLGHCGFHGPPGMPHLEPHAPGGVEMGYTVFPAFRRQGYASEAVRGLMGWAAAQGVPSFVLSIAPANAPSQAIARCLGFVQVSSHDDPEDGLEEIFTRPPL